MRLACLLVDDRGLGEEVVQEAFVRVYRAWTLVDEPLICLRTTVVNLARSRLGRRAVARRYVPPASLPEASADGAGRGRESILFQLPSITSLVSDPSGSHLLIVTVEKAVYRWSPGESQPTKLADGVAAATWLAGP